MTRKAADYSGTVDCNQNIKACEHLGIASAEKGILIRMTDKISRLARLVGDKQEAQVKDESIRDTVMDLRNYALILYHVYKERSNVK